MSMVDCTTQSPCGQIRTAAFLASLVLASQDCPWDEFRRLYSALNVPGTTAAKLGLKASKLVPAPYDLDPTYLFQTNRGGGFAWETALTPPGSITHTHADFFGSGQYMVHIEGKKLWLLWPPTDHNLKQMVPLENKPTKPSATLHAIQKLEGLQLLYVEKPLHTFIIPPNYYHACLSLATSAHAGIRYWSYSTFKEAARIIDFHLKWRKDTARFSDVPEALQLFKALEDDELGWWRILADKNPNDSFTPTVTAFIQETADQIRRFRLALSTGKRKRGE